jgi:short-subunit dehydrogenase
MIGKLNAIITGASSGIGSAIASLIASAGGSVCLVGQNPERLEAVANVARTTARSVLICRADLTIDSAIIELRNRIEREFKSLDVLIHCAGVFSTGSIENTPVQQLDTLYRTNLRAPYVLTQVFLPMLKSQQGQIVFINSSQGLQAKANSGLYASTKHGLKALADSLRQEINPDGVRVLSIYPGRTATPSTQTLFGIEGRSYRPELLLQPMDVAQAVINALEMPRTAELTNVEMRPLIKSY